MREYEASVLWRSAALPRRRTPPAVHRKRLPDFLSAPGALLVAFLRFVIAGAWSSTMMHYFLVKFRLKRSVHPTASRRFRSTGFS